MMGNRRQGNSEWHQEFSTFSQIIKNWTILTRGVTIVLIEVNQSKIDFRYVCLLCDTGLFQEVGILNPYAI